MNAQEQGNRNRRIHDEMANAIRLLKSSPNPRSEHALILTLTRLDHPDVKGLLDALEARFSSGKRPRGEL